MPNGGDYVSWEHHGIHEQKIEQLEKTQLRIQAEVMGDEETGRPSLRVDLTSQMAIVSNKMDRFYHLVARIGGGLIVSILAKWVYDWYAVAHPITEILKH